MKWVKQKALVLDFAMAPITDAPVYLRSSVKPLKHKGNGPFVRNQFGQLVWVYRDFSYVSDDDGMTWQTYAIFADNAVENLGRNSTDKKWVAVNDCHCLVLSKQNTLVLSYIYDTHFKWHRKTNKPTKNTHAYQWVIRSEDGGKTWSEPQLIQAGYAAETMSMVVLESGRLVLAAQNLDYDEGRHYCLSFYSDDDGLTWHASNKLDIGGRGHHGGCFEGCLLPLKDGRLWYCIRTNRDWLWNAYSEDNGESWTQMQTGLPASSSPATLTRLQSGRILMVYNQLYRDGETNIKRRSGFFSEVEASWQREELSITFSEDEGLTWSKPQVIAKCKDAWLAYAFVFEASAGEIWVTTMQSELRISFKEQDFID